MRSSTHTHITCLVSGLALLLAGCSGNEASKISPGASNNPKPAQSITRLDAPYDRSFNYTLQLNNRRFETFGVNMPVTHSNVAYTAAFRHAVFLNTTNSANYRPNGASGQPVGTESAIITGDTPYASFRTEAAPAATGIFPALFTNTDSYSRVAAVVGSPDLLSGIAASDVREFFVFNGNIPTATAGAAGQLRGFNLDASTNANPTKYLFTPVDNIWYSSRGRTALMRASLKAWAYGSAYDGNNCLCPPWPIVGQRFLGTVTTVNYAQKVAMFGFWPSRNNTDVSPYGLDPDIATVGGVDNVRHDYSGPPIHITLPVAEPFLMHPTRFAGGVTLSFRKLGGGSSDDIPQPLPNSSIQRTLVFRMRQTGIIRTLWNNPQTVGGVPGPGPYDYSFLGSSSSFDAGDEMQNGELIMVPTEPLEPNSWYEVGVRLRTPSYVLPVDSTNESELFTWRFRTNTKTPY